MPPSCTVKVTCGTALCVVPAHLYVAPLVAGLNLTTGQAARGADHGNAKLTWRQRRAVQKAQGLYSTRELAKHYGVSPSTICRIQQAPKV